MPENQRKQVAMVTRSALIVAVLISIILTAVIVGSIVFAWQNSEVTKDDLFRHELLKTETDSLQDQMDIVNQQAQ